MEPITEAAGTGLTHLATDYGIAGILGVLLIVGSVYIIRYFMNHCEKRTDIALTSFKEESSNNRAVIDKNTEAFHGVQLALTEMKARLDK